MKKFEVILNNFVKLLDYDILDSIEFDFYKVHTSIEIESCNSIDELINIIENYKYGLIIIHNNNKIEYFRFKDKKIEMQKRNRKLNKIQNEY